MLFGHKILTTICKTSRIVRSIYKVKIKFFKSGYQRTFLWLKRLWNWFSSLMTYCVQLVDDILRLS